MNRITPGFAPVAANGRSWRDTATRMRRVLLTAPAPPAIALALAAPDPSHADRTPGTTTRSPARRRRPHKLFALAVAIGLLAPGGVIAASDSQAVPPSPPPVLQSEYEPPEYGNYFQCVPLGALTHVYVDFVDPDGEDANMTVRMRVMRPKLGWGQPVTMHTSDGYHGVFFWRAVFGKPVKYAFQATDEDGLKSPWVPLKSTC